MSGGSARPLISHVTKGRAQCGGTIISRGQRGGAMKSKNKEQPGPGVRQTAVAIERLGGYRYAHAGPCPLLKEPRQIQANNRDGVTVYFIPPNFYPGG